jgi:hypothetical protein
MARFYHGSDLELISLKKNSYVTKNFKDACKFGYRKSVLSDSQFVFVHSVEIETPEISLEIDENRDRAFVTLAQNKVKLIYKYSTFETPFKLEKFKKEIQERSEI